MGALRELGNQKATCPGPAPSSLAPHPVTVTQHALAHCQEGDKLEVVQTLPALILQGPALQVNPGAGRLPLQELGPTHSPKSGSWFFFHLGEGSGVEERRPQACFRGRPAAG